jgi:outer membrane receptor protein involved in Fe transport
MKYILGAILFLLSFSSYSQGALYNITGTLTEANSDQAIEYATVVAKDLATNDIIGGTTTEIGGKFELAVNKSNVFLEISFIGYTTLIIDDIAFEKQHAFLGNLTLETDAFALEEVTVSAAKSTTEFKLDKRVFNVGADLSSAGGSALEVLSNVPSVNVNIEGQISLRGSSGVQVLINGKPSILADEGGNALGTITSDMIDKIEVITNPSAKYEAEGTAGIINIVLKKNEKKGLNGSISVNSGIPHNHSVGLSLNRRTEKFNLFTQLGVGYREIPTDLEFISEDKTNNTSLTSTGEEFRNELFYNLNLGTDYYINPQNVITLSGSFAYEIEDQPSITNFQFFENGSLTREWFRDEVTEATNPKLQYELQYKRDFTDHKDHQLLFSAIGRFFGKEQSSVFNNTFTSGVSNLSPQETETAFEEGKYTFNLDYTKPINQAVSIEAGAQYLTNDVSNDFEVRDLINGEFVTNAGLTNLFEYGQKVFGIYGTAAYEGSVWGIKGGLRVENTDISTLLVNTNEANSQNFTDLFPSVHSSYKLTEAISFQAGYSRRIYRPRLWDLNPFFNIRNNFNFRAGNPDLQPEYTDSYEVGSIFIFDQVSLNVNGYYRLTTDKIERISLFEDNVTVSRPENIGINKAAGLETNFKYTVSKSITLNGDFNYNIFQREGVFSDQVFDFSADQWTGELTIKSKISKSFDVEISGQHESRIQTVQGIRSANTFANVGLRYKILDGKGVFNFSIRDLFASRIDKLTIDNEDFFLYSERQRGRFVTLGFSYGFGKGEAMQFSGRRR